MLDDQLDTVHAPPQHANVQQLPASPRLPMGQAVSPLLGSPIYSPSPRPPSPLVPTPSPQPQVPLLDAHAPPEEGQEIFADHNPPVTQHGLNIQIPIYDELFWQTKHSEYMQHFSEATEYPEMKYVQTGTYSLHSCDFPPHCTCFFYLSTNVMLPCRCWCQRKHLLCWAVVRAEFP